MAEKFDHLEEHLEKFVENIRQLGIIVSDFQPSSQAGLNQKLNFIVTGLQDIDKCRQQLHDITVPLEVFEYIDQGRNPQLYTKECLERALARNEQVKGKIDTMKGFGEDAHTQTIAGMFPALRKPPCPSRSQPFPSKTVVSACLQLHLAGSILSPCAVLCK
ncbi:mediator of RNA polymerase II transcription subunit 10 isoform X1 [Hyaena hyaena]|uniref:mediator of RNA polymerase II transcription subunit 10 isoform X1 n=1 Tax=Hyaena hyaena TaxID=95912 RepID=UPI00192267E9|nr:mediator of RNA polymerase II transcription subunit 10 isoform X1 [Hyaena hyaena]